MRNCDFGRVSDFNGLPELIVKHAGFDGLSYAFSKHSLSLELLKEPDAVVLMKDIISLYRSAAEVSGIRSFGLDSAREQDINEYGAIGGFILQAPNLKKALLRFQRALPYYESGSQLTLQEIGDELIVGYENIYQCMAGFRHAGDMTIRIIEGVIRTYAGSDWRPKRILTCAAKGLWERDYEDAFLAPVVFGNEKIELVLEREFANSCTNDSDIQLGGLLSFEDVQRVGQDLPTDFPGVVGNLVERGLSTGSVSLETISESLLLGPRTVQRRLDNHGLSFRQVLKLHRMKSACKLLSGTEASIERVSHELGYSSASHFTRAFSKCHGIGPGEFRQSHHENP